MSEPLKAGDRVRCKMTGYEGLKGTLDELQGADVGTMASPSVRAAWVKWDLPDDERARCGCFFLLSDLERLSEKSER